MIYLPQTLLDIVNSGGGLIIDLNKQTFLPQTLIKIAQAAKISGAIIIIKNPKFLLPQTMQQIARAGSGRVIFEL
jgi:3-deoxy-D-manno-octulosonic acid (KDO) 8-phosphate synthase